MGAGSLCRGILSLGCCLSLLSTSAGPLDGDELRWVPGDPVPPLAPVPPQFVLPTPLPPLEERAREVDDFSSSYRWLIPILMVLTGVAGGLGGQAVAECEGLTRG